MVHWPEQSTADGGEAWCIGQNNLQQMGRSMVHWPEQSTVGGREAWCIGQNNPQ